MASFHEMGTMKVQSRVSNGSSGGELSEKHDPLTERQLKVGEAQRQGGQVLLWLYINGSKRDTLKPGHDILHMPLRDCSRKVQKG